MAFDFKKEYKEFYMPKNKPQIVTIPKANYIAVRGKGNPNEEGGEYKTAIGVLYAVAYTLKMSYKTDYKIEGFFEYVVPPLEGFWWQDNVESIDYTDKSAFNWISVIRLPDFITKKDFDWAVETASKKKKMDCSGAEFLSIDEGLCVQIMHIGAFDDEPATVAMMDKYLEENGYVNDFTDERRHHEIYLSDPRKVAPEKCKTVIRHPIPMPDDFNIENYTKEVFFMFSGEKVLVDLRCDNSLMKTMVDRFGEDVTTLAYDMTSFRVQTEVSASPTFFGWVFGFNGKVQILAPESVKEQYRQMISQADEGMQESE